MTIANLASDCWQHSWHAIGSHDTKTLLDDRNFAKEGQLYWNLGLSSSMLWSVAPFTNMV